MFDQFEKFDTKANPKNPTLVGLSTLIGALEVWKHKAKISKVNMKGIKPPYILLANHNAFLDIQMLRYITFPHKMSYIVAIDGFLGRKKFLESIGCICKRKFTTDPYLVKNIDYVLNTQKNIMAMFPEARYSLCGTNAIIPTSVARLVKHFNVPLVILKMKGHHINSPFWNLRMRHVKVREARKILTDQEAAKLIDSDAVQEEAVQRTEQNGIVFIDEIDKIAGSNGAHGPDVSREGVQRDILPIVEGCTVNTKYGAVKTDHMLFIAAGAFHVSKVSDLIPELQGRFPVHVHLKSLTKEDFMQIMTVPENALTKQYEALLAVDKVMLKFEDSAISAIAEAACNANENAEDIGARRLHAIFEQLLEDVLFNAGDENMPPFELKIDEAYVNDRLKGENKPMDIRKFIL